jgi:molybdopterin-guanine dinucleotide biosynthesis protein A
MGTDKAHLQLAGQPLIAHATAKLCRLCAEVHILAGEDPAAFATDAARTAPLAAHAPLVFDLHPNCGPIAGIEAALAHSPHPWNLILPVDMPFLPAAFLHGWVQEVLHRPQARVAMFEVAGRTQSMPLLIHRAARPHLTRAIERRDYTLLTALLAAAAELGAAPDTSASPQPERERWFANINTPEQFADANQRAETHIDALDPL